MKYNLRFCAFLFLGLTACKPSYREVANGTLFVNYTNNDGPKIKTGDFVCINEIIKTESDSIMNDTYVSGTTPLMIISKPIYKGDVIDMLSDATEGDSISVKLLADSVFKKAVRPSNFKSKYVIFDIKVEKVIAKGNMTDTVLRTKAREYVKKMYGIRKKQEPAKIKRYIAINKLKGKLTDSGLYYTIKKAGTGPLLKHGDTVLINFIGYLFNDKIFDTNVSLYAHKANIFKPYRKYVPMKMIIGAQNSMPGLSQGLKMLSNGGEGLFILNSDLAYGDLDAGFAGPYTPVVFKVEVLDVRRFKKDK